MDSQPSEATPSTTGLTPGCSICDQRIPFDSRERFLYHKSHPLVSVITPCYNYEQYLEDAIESVGHQTYPNIEHIIMHCGCGTNQPTSLPKARNELIRSATGKYILPLDSDDKIAPDCIEKLILNKDKADIISCELQEFEGGSAHYTPHTRLSYEDFYQENRIHCSALFPRSLWEEVGYDENLVDAFEDWDFWLRATKLGKTVYIVPEVLFFYRKHLNSMTTRIGATNALAKFRKKHPL